MVASEPEPRCGQSEGLLRLVLDGRDGAVGAQTRQSFPRAGLSLAADVAGHIQISRHGPTVATKPECGAAPTAMSRPAQLSCADLFLRQRAGSEAVPRRFARSAGGYRRVGGRRSVLVRFSQPGAHPVGVAPDGDPAAWAVGPTLPPLRAGPLPTPRSGPPTTSGPSLRDFGSSPRTHASAGPRTPHRRGAHRVLSPTSNGACSGTTCRRPRAW